MNLWNLLLSPWLATGIAVVGLYAARSEFIEIARGDNYQRLFGTRRTAPSRSAPGLPAITSLPAPTGAEPVTPIQGEVLADAVRRLVEYARDYKPDVLLGVHVSGRLVSAYVASELGISDSHCLYVGSGIEAGSEFSIDGDRSVLEGRALIVDDISRTGETLYNLRNYIALRQGSGDVNFSHVAFAVLVSCASEASFDKNFVIDWVSFKANAARCVFPWTLTRLNIKHALEARKTGTYLEYYLNIYNGIRSSCSIALDEFMKASAIGVPGNLVDGDLQFSYGLRLS